MDPQRRGAATALAAVNATTGAFPVAGARQVAGRPLGLPLSTYTAALIANTAVPVWHEARRTLPFVFAAGAAACAGAAARSSPRPVRGAARRLAVGAAVAEAVSME